MTYHPSQDPWGEQMPPPPPPPPYGPPAGGGNVPPYPTAQVPPAAGWNQQPRRQNVSRRLKIAFGSLAALMLLCCGGLVVAVITSPQPTRDQNDTAAQVAPTVNATEAPSTGLAETTAPTEQATPSAATSADAPTSAAPAAPVVVTRTVTETQKIAYPSRNVYDSSLPKGTRKVTTRGVAGVKTLTYQVTLTNGVQTAKKLIRSQVTKAPVTQVITIGTKQARQCDPNYSGACVPIASDVDCAGGSGNGPAYVQGPVRVIGTDIYDLDRDGDGIGCDT